MATRRRRKGKYADSNVMVTKEVSFPVETKSGKLWLSLSVKTMWTPLGQPSTALAKVTTEPNGKGRKVNAKKIQVWLRGADQSTEPQSKWLTNSKLKGALVSVDDKDMTPNLPQTIVARARSWEPNIGKIEARVRP